VSAAIRYRQSLDALWLGSITVYSCNNYARLQAASSARDHGEREGDMAAARHDMSWWNVRGHFITSKMRL
jgi:hypothetical protein